MIISEAAKQRSKRLIKLIEEVLRDSEKAERGYEEALNFMYSYRNFTECEIRKVLAMPEKDLSSEARYKLLQILLRRDPTPGPELDAFLKRDPIRR